MRDEIYQRILERNARETDPFRGIHESYSHLVKQVDTLQVKLDYSEKEASRLKQEIHDSIAASAGNGKSGGAAAAALKNETRLRDKLEKLQDEYNAKVKAESQEKTEALKSAKRISELMDINSSQTILIDELRKEIERNQRTITHLQTEVDDSKSSRKLAEQQYDGLKLTIRSLQEENDELKKENRQLEGYLISEKGKLVDEMNVLTEMVESLKLENSTLRRNAAPPLETKERNTGWFGISYKQPKSETPPPAAVNKSSMTAPPATPPKFGISGVVLPSTPKHIVVAHSMEGMSVRYDASGKDLVATSSSDSTVKVWDTMTGTVRATLQGTPGHAMLACDLYGSLVVGASTDKTCRVWNLRTERMLHHLVGHQHKVTCVRLCGNGEAVLTGSADRSLKVWDISRQTYKQTTTLRHGSTPHCVDVGSNSFSAVSGHLDGGLRFWDLRTGDRTMDLTDMHEGGISSVQFSPVSSTQVLTNAMDSCVKLVDIRTGTAVHTFRHEDFSTTQSYSTATLSPDGRYVAAGSSSDGSIFVWDAVHGTLKARLSDGHEAGVCCIGWGRGEQQVATIDRRGKLVLWA